MSSSPDFLGGQKGVFIAFVLVAFLLIPFTPSALAEVAVHPVPNPDGFMAPTLEGPWRTNISLSAWAPSRVRFKTDNGESKETVNKNLGWLLDVIDYEVPIEVEVRKGSFGAYAHLLAFKISDTIHSGHLSLEYDDAGYLLDAGISYELGHWALGSEATLTLEPFAGIRYLYDPVDVTIRYESLKADRTITLTNTSPVFGMRAFVDLTEQWNLRFDGDYGGFGVDDNYETWNLRGLGGYRFSGWGVGWNIQAGYRATRVMGFQTSAGDVRIDIHGPIALISVEF
jgi:opacity protein-like surface antigen